YEIYLSAACGSYQEFNGSCFQAYNNLPLSYDAGEAYCQSECGNLVSIHSADENDSIYNLLGHTTNYARIGLKRSGNSYVWTDTTRFDYNNVGYSNPAFGDCIAMSLVDELVAHGEWISVACEQALPFVCKRDGDCLRSTTVAPPTPATLAPPTCDGPSFMDTNGTFYSPGYPESYRNAKACYYVMTVAADQKVEIYFVDLQLSTGSNIQLFNSIADSIPFATITVNTTARYFTSSTNVMKMTFVAGNDAAGINRWEAMFGPGSKVITTTPPITITPSPTNPSGCNQNSLVPTDITSPNYPNDYPPLTQCRYQLSTDSGYKIQLTFGAIDTEQCCDIIDVYDYDGTPYYPLLDR
ncbi:lectin C-type domain protein, partial [Oesophagostomum dentatum]